MVRPALAPAQDRQPGRADLALEVRDPGQAEALERRPHGRVAADSFGFVQLEFGFKLGPPDGRYLVRSGGGEQPDAVLVLGTLGAPQRRRLSGRRGRSLEEAEPEPVPTSRATVVRPQPFGSAAEATEWLATVRSNGDRADEELGSAVAVLNRALHAHRVAAAEAHPRDVAADQALVIRIGFGSGEDAAGGRFAEAWELPRERRRTRRTMEAPDERFAAILGGRERSLACEELVLRARSDLDAGRPREAALEARVALEALLAELPEASEPAADREAVGAAANAALRGPLTKEAEDDLAAALGRMEHALKRRRLGA